MNEIERAIKHFEGLQKRYTTSHNGKHCELVKTALAALQEKAERDEGCECCGLIYKLDGASYGTDSEIIENRYCPMCGKRLEEQQ